MALPPKFAGQRYPSSAQSSSPTSLHTLEIYLDYVCPYSAKMFKTLYDTVLPLIRERYADKVQVLFRQQIQPWHPSSTLVHEAGVAVLKFAPERFWEFSKVLFEASPSYYDVNVVNETRNETYARLARLGASIGIDEGEIYSLLHINDKAGPDGSLNSGNGVTNDLKVLVKMNRMQGVHVTPTVVFDGVVENAISSGWDGGMWGEWLERHVA